MEKIIFYFSKKTADLRTTYVHDKAHVETNITAETGSPNVNGAVVLGHRGFLAGYSYAYSTARGALTRSNALVGFEGKDFVASVSLFVEIPNENVFLFNELEIFLSIFILTEMLQKSWVSTYTNVSMINSNPVFKSLGSVEQTILHSLWRANIKLTLKQRSVCELTTDCFLVFPSNKSFDQVRLDRKKLIRLKLNLTSTEFHFLYF